MRPGGTQRGFTLVELLITVVVLAVLASVAVPSFQSYILQNRVKTGGQTLFTSLLYARSEAVKRNEPVYVYPKDGDWSEGWAVTFEQNNTDCHSDKANCLRIQDAISGISIDTAADDVTYLSSGRVADVVSFDLCDEDGSSTVRKRQISTDLTGRPTIDYVGDCS